MATKQRRPLTDEEREARRAAQRELVCASIEQLRTSDGWQSYLNARRRFPSYSWRNVLLILHQRPTATRVAGFRTWLDLGYCVRKRPDDVPEGAWAIRIWARCEPSRKRIQAWRDAGADPDERPRATYKLVNVFAQDQVQELPPPATPAPLEAPIAEIRGDSHDELLPRLAQAQRRARLHVHRRRRRPGRRPVQHQGQDDRRRRAPRTERPRGGRDPRARARARRRGRRRPQAHLRPGGADRRVGRLVLLSDRRARLQRQQHPVPHQLGRERRYRRSRADRRAHQPPRRPHRSRRLILAAEPEPAAA